MTALNKNNNFIDAEINSDPPDLQYNNGFKEWYDENKNAHRENGPATIYANGDCVWYYHGKKHRIDGPAVICIDGYKEWYYMDEKINCSTQEEYEKILKMKVFW